MDDRKKKIGELEKCIKSNQINLGIRLEGLGKALLSRPEIARVNEKFSEPEIFKTIEEYRRLQKEIEDSEASIREVEIHSARLRELEEDIQAKESEESAQIRELAGYYKKLGKLVLETSDADDLSSAYRTQADVLVPKIQSLEERLAGLTNQTEGGNVFTWIGKSAQGMVLRSFLTKSLDNLEKLYHNTGEQFFRGKAENPGFVSDSDIADSIEEITENKGVSAAVAEELARLREERGIIDNEFAASGGPLRQIQGIKKKISHAQDLLKTLYLHFGEAASGSAASGDEKKAGTSKKQAKGYASLIDGSAQEILDDIIRLRQLIQNDGTAIEKLRASLAIDEEWEKIEKYRRSIAEKKARITEAEQGIAEFESRISDAEKHIEELQQLL
jgi:DNA repair exonuclease SbcCD ATPase subunit